ncbi:VWA domain-containing protein [Spartinivicinus poritis]|uniref:VWA domain-containing protein n=1 Tax=Spartinivicinus poritis TaxID=2994640 RepID=A0ABT5UDQ1_9GAMM|nr:VWA domain-containing protein [Spartinivicinus sp. A2-2]MDE1464496.1 VWA domain-containing protein [Spartinivicinus sp. A2-2]
MTHRAGSIILASLFNPHLAVVKFIISTLRQGGRAFIPFLLLLLFRFIVVSAAFAEESDQSPSTQVAAADVRMLVDISGSMKINDPQNLRVPAIELMVELLPKGSKAGVWNFGQHIKPLVPYDEVNDKWRQQARQQVGKINSTGLFTNIREALNVAAFDRNTQAKQPRHIILLTDGMVDISKDPDKNKTERERIITEQIPVLSQAGYTIHTIALSSNSDRELMDTLAIETGGFSSEANDAEALTKLFLKALEQTAPAEQVPLKDNKFLVDSSVEEFTLLVFKPRLEAVTQLLSPDQTLYSKDNITDDIKWHSTDQYDLVTVQKPYEGEWLLQAEPDPDNRVTIVSDLKLKVNEIPSNLFLGQEVELDFWFEEQGKTILKEEFLQVIQGSWRVYQTAKLISEQPIKGEDSLKEGHFTDLLKPFPELGDYRIELVIDANTFNRRYAKLVSVRQPFKIESELFNEDGQDKYLVVVKPRSQSIDRKSSKVIAQVRYPDGTKQLRPVPLYKDGRSWRFSIERLQQGQHKVFFNINAQAKDGQSLKIETAPIILNYPETQTATVEAGVAPEPEPEKAEQEVEPEEDTSTEAEQEPETEEQLDAEEEPEGEAEAAEDELGWITYAGIALGNILVLGGLFFAYKKLIKSGDEKLDDEAAESDKEGTGNEEKTSDEKPEVLEAELEEPDEPEPEPEEEPMAEDDDMEIELPADDLEDLTASEPVAEADEPPPAPSEAVDEEQAETKDQLDEDDIPTEDPEDLLNEDFDLSGGDESDEKKNKSE